MIPDEVPMDLVPLDGRLMTVDEARVHVVRMMKRPASKADGMIKKAIELRGKLLEEHPGWRHLYCSSSEFGKISRRGI